MSARWARIGDLIETTLSDGNKLCVELLTPHAVAYANDLIAANRWKVVEEKPTPRPANERSGE